MLRIPAIGIEVIDLYAYSVLHASKANFEACFYRKIEIVGARNEKITPQHDFERKFSQTEHEIFYFSLKFL